MDLDLDILGMIPRAGPGRQAKPVSAEYSRDLTPADLAMASVTVVKPKPLAKIRDSHHSVARLLATGTKDFEIAAVTGYSASRISILKGDPQFQELVEFYRETTTDVVADFRDRMAGLGLDALQELQDRMEDKPEDFSPGLLREIVKDMADRTGHAPQRGPTAVTNINVSLTDRMAKARERVQSIPGRVINHE